MTDAYYCKRDEGMCLQSRDVFKFQEMSDNISNTVQHRDIVATEE